MSGTGEAISGMSVVGSDIERRTEGRMTDCDYYRGQIVTRAETPRATSFAQHSAVGAKDKHAPLPPNGLIRRDLERSVNRAVSSADLMVAAVEDSDIPALAVAAADLSSAVANIWQYREFGRRPWQQVVQLCQQALGEPDSYEDFKLTQAKGLAHVCKHCLTDRHLLPDERKAAVTTLTDSGFDVFRMISPAN